MIERFPTNRVGGREGRRAAKTCLVSVLRRGEERRGEERSPPVVAVQILMVL